MILCPQNVSARRDGLVALARSLVVLKVVTRKLTVKLDVLITVTVLEVKPTRGFVLAKMGTLESTVVKRHAQPLLRRRFALEMVNVITEPVSVMKDTLVMLVP
jgi:hypothetical protein